MFESPHLGASSDIARSHLLYTDEGGRLNVYAIGTGAFTECREDLGEETGDSWEDLVVAE